MYRVLILVSVVSVLTAPGFSQNDLPVESEGSITAFTDYCSFRGDSSASYVEVYIQALVKGLEFTELDDGSVEAELSFEATLKRVGGEPVGRRSWSVPVKLSSLADASQEGLSLYELFDTAIQPGTYTLDLELSDASGERSATLVQSLEARAYEDERFQVSDIQLARSVQRAESAGLWVKNGYCMVPNPSRRYGRALSTVAFYAEVYGLEEPEGESEGRFTVVYSIMDMEGKPIRAKGPFLMPKGGSSAILIGQMNVADIEPGYYRLEIAVCDTVTFDLSACSSVARSSKVFVRGEDLPKLPHVRGLTPAESTAAEIELRYMASRAEIKKFRELTPVGRTRYLEQLWVAKDPDPSTAENEARTDLHQRVAHAQAAFGELRRIGMDTDRGRVFITYGPPDEISTITGERVCKNHQIWLYYKEHEWKFVFMDQFGTAEYRLIHSNYPGEVEREDWEGIVCEQSHVQFN